MADFNKFLIDLSAQLNLSMMDGPQRERLIKLQKNNTATKDQDSWNPDAALPDPAAYNISNNDDWLQLYTIFQEALKNIDLNRTDIAAENPKLITFLDKYYGFDKATERFVICREVTSILSPKLNNLQAFLTDPNIIMSLQDSGTSYEDLDNLVNKIQDRSYKRDPKALKTLRSVIVHVYNDPNMLHAFTTGIGITNADLVTIYNNINKPEPPRDLTNFKGDYSKIIEALIKDNELRTAFNKYDKNKTISYAISDGVNKTNYSDSNSKNYITPIYDDRKRLFDTAKGKVTGFIDDRFNRLESRHKRHLYSTNAKFIVPEILKNKINPIDGLGKIIENADKIKSGLQASAPKAANEFDYLTKVLKKLSGTKAFAEATKDGAQMRYVVSEIIKDAVHNGKKEEAKVALETLAIIRYDFNTSSVRDNLKKADMTIFSDKGLSWNKHESMQFISTGLDKTIRLAGLAAFNIGNFAKNKLVREPGLKFKNGTKRIKEAQKSPDFAAKQAEFEELFAFWDFVNSGKETSNFMPFVSHRNMQKKFDPASAFANFEWSNSIGK